MKSIRLLVTALALTGTMATLQAADYSNQQQVGMMTDGTESSKAFLAANAKEHGVVTLPSGLQYKVVTAGTGTQPTATSTVTVDYEGKLINGQVFDSSYARGKPISFALNQVIPGWTEGVSLMKTGATYMLYIPSNLAYGAQGVPGVIPPNSALIFKVHLIAVR